MTHAAIAGTWNQAVNVAYLCGWNLDNNATKALNDEVALGRCYIPKAVDYTAYALFSKYSTAGKMHFLINDTDEGNIDGYAAATSYDHSESVSLGTLTAGLKSINIKMASKNAAASGYLLGLQVLIIRET